MELVITSSKQDVEFMMGGPSSLYPQSHRYTHLLSTQRLYEL